MKKKASKRLKLNITLVAVKVLLCLCLLIGGTVALFTAGDEVNVFVTAAEIEMELYTVDLDGTETNIGGAHFNIFGEEDWEPGQTRVVFFKVKSLANIDVKYTLNMVVPDAVFDGAIQYCAFEGHPFDVKNTTWESLTRGRTVSYLAEGSNPISGSTFVEMAPGEEHYYALFVHMRTDAGNSFQNKLTNIDVHLYATQGNSTEQ